MNKMKKKGKTSCEVNVRYNGKVIELIGTNINSEFKILI